MKAIIIIGPDRGLPRRPVLRGGGWWLLIIRPFLSYVWMLSNFIGLAQVGCFLFSCSCLAVCLCECVFLLTSPYACTLCLMLFLGPFVFGLAGPCTCWRKDRITRSCASHTCVTWLAKSLSFFPSCTSNFLSLLYKSFSTTDPWLPTTTCKLICWYNHAGKLLWAHRWCFWDTDKKGFS